MAAAAAESPDRQPDEDGGSICGGNFGKVKELPGDHRPIVFVPGPRWCDCKRRGPRQRYTPPKGSRVNGHEAGDMGKAHKARASAECRLFDAGQTPAAQ